MNRRARKEVFCDFEKDEITGNRPLCDKMACDHKKLLKSNRMCQFAVDASGAQIHKADIWKLLLQNKGK